MNESDIEDKAAALLKLHNDRRRRNQLRGTKSIFVDAETHRTLTALAAIYGVKIPEAADIVLEYARRQLSDGVTWEEMSK